LLSLRSFFLPWSQGMTQAPQTDAVPVCTAIPMAYVSSIEPCHLRVASARSVSSGAMGAVARMFKTIICPSAAQCSALMRTQERRMATWFFQRMDGNQELETVAIDKAVTTARFHR
jgi:hypothetical protein